MVKFLVVTLGTFAATGLLWLCLRNYAHSKLFEKAEYPLAHDPFMIVAHRGGALEAPENTIEAFSRVSQLKSPFMIELDVRLTADQNIVVHHDETVDRTTNGHGRVRAMTLSELQDLDAGFQFQNEHGEFVYRGKGIKIPTLRQVLDQFPTTKFIIEIKDDFTGVGEAVAEIIHQAHAGERVIVASQHLKMISEARRYIEPNPYKERIEDDRRRRAQWNSMPGPERVAHAPAVTPPPGAPPFIKSPEFKVRPNWMFGATEDEVQRTVFLLELGLGGLDPMKAEFYLVPEKAQSRVVVTPDLISEAHRRGRKVFVWTINDQSDFQRLIKMNVDGVITDCPHAFAEALLKNAL